MSQQVVVETRNKTTHSKKMVSTTCSTFIRGLNTNNLHTNYNCLSTNHTCNHNQFQKNPFSSHSTISSSKSPRLISKARGLSNDHLFPEDAAYSVLGVQPGCSAAQLKAAFRAKVKEFHPDVRKDKAVSDVMIRRVIKAYEILSSYSRSEIIERECLDPFDNPESEAYDIFVNEILCVGKGCPYSCVKQAPHAFTFSSMGTARANSQGHGDDYQVQVAVGQCPRSCIHYVTPSQRIILEELLDSILDTPWDTSAEADLLYSLIIKAKYENNRYQKPKRQPKTSTQHVDWF